MNIVVPKNEDMERSLLGSILIDPNQMLVAMEHMPEPSMFYNSVHQKIFTAMKKLYDNSRTIDPVILIDEIGSESAEYIANLMESVAVSGHAEQYAKELKQKHIRRELFHVCQKGMKVSCDEEEFETADDVANAITTMINKAIIGLGNVDMYSVDEACIRIEQYFNDYDIDISENCVKTGFTSLDDLIGGLYYGENIVIAGRPSMGKTALALNIAKNIAKQGVMVLFFSLEQTREAIIDRMICSGAMVNSKSYKMKRLTESEKQRVADSAIALTGLPMAISERGVSTTEIRSIIAKQMTKHGKVVVIIDYLTLLRDKRHGNTRTDEHWGSIAKSLQAMSKEFKIPLVTLSQLNRRVEERTNKRPILSDLRESGDIEASADKVFFTYRDDYYNPNSEDKGIAEIICAKNKEGETGMVKLAWHPEYVTFNDLSYMQPE